MNVSSIWQLFAAVALVLPVSVGFAGVNGSDSSFDEHAVARQLGACGDSTDE